LRRTFKLACALLTLASAALAQTGARPYTKVAVTVGTGSARVLNQNNSRTHLELYNQSATATIYCTVDGTAAVAAATAGQITIPPLAGQVWGTGQLPSNEFNCIATASSTPLTILQ
jgi:hypothetical protein